MNSGVEVDEVKLIHFEDCVKRRCNHEPLQYIIGMWGFYKYSFKVGAGVLIPRPETQELVDIIISRHGEEKDLRVMDVGTGSGCIAISLARGLKFAQVSAIDISQQALEVARENAKMLKTRVNFECRDALSLTPKRGEKYDIIVSNPPYIAEYERKDMEHSVLDYEPSTALFVPNDDPLRFYRAIASFAVEALSQGGHIYYEINPLFASEMLEMMRGMGYNDIEIINDMQGRKRMLCARK